MNMWSHLIFPLLALGLGPGPRCCPVLAMRRPQWQPAKFQPAPDDFLKLP